MTMKKFIHMDGQILIHLQKIIHYHFLMKIFNCYDHCHVHHLFEIYHLYELTVVLFLYHFILNLLNFLYFQYFIFILLIFVMKKTITFLF